MIRELIWFLRKARELINHARELADDNNLSSYSD